MMSRQCAPASLRGSAGPGGRARAGAPGPGPSRRLFRRPTGARPKESAVLGKVERRKTESGKGVAQTCLDSDSARAGLGRPFPTLQLRVQHRLVEAEGVADADGRLAVGSPAAARGGGVRPPVFVSRDCRAERNRFRGCCFEFHGPMKKIHRCSCFPAHLVSPGVQSRLDVQLRRIQCRSTLKYHDRHSCITG